MGRIVQLETRTAVDHETGEVTRSEHSKVINLPQEPPYVKMYIDDLGRLLDVPAGPRTVLYQLVRRLDYDGFISLTPAARKRIAEACEIGVPTMSNYLTSLVQSKILKHVGRGEYEMNPHLFAKGDWKDISKRRQDFELSISYSADGKRVVNGKAVPSKAAGTQIDLEDYLKTGDKAR